MLNTDKSGCEHATKLTGECVKCGAYPYDTGKAVTDSGKAPSVKIGIEQANGESFVKRVNEILARHARFIKNDVYTAEQFEEQAKAIRDSITRALEHADLYLRIDGKIVATQ